MKTTKTRMSNLIFVSLFAIAITGISIVTMSKPIGILKVKALHECLADGQDLFNQYQYGNHACAYKNCDGINPIGPYYYAGGASYCMPLHNATCENVYCEDIRCTTDGVRCYPWDSPISE